MALDISTARSDIAKIYIAAFNRVPDSDGLNFWVNAYLNGASLTSIASGFATSTEYATKYPSYQTNTEYVAAVYQNVFGRAVDTGGSKFWTDALDAGTLTKAGLLNSLVSAAAANGSTDGARLTNQAEFGVYCASNNIQWTNATTALSAITSDTATVTTAKTTVSTNEANTSHILTTGQDTPIGTSGNDEFRAVAGATIGTQDQTTLNSSDVIDGGAGTDTLIVNMTGATYSGGARIKNIETLKIGTNLAAATFDYNVNAGSNEVTEVTKIVADQINTGEALTVNNIVKTSGALPKLSWENDSNTANAGIVNYNYRAAELTGTTDKDNQAVDLKSVTNGVLNLAAGIETVSLTSVGTERVTLNNSTNTDTTGTGTPYNNTADLVSNGTLTNVVLAGTAEIGKAAEIIATTGLTDRTVLSDTGSGATTQSNLLSVESRVTEVYASDATAAVNVRFVAKTDGSATNVTFKGGSAADYVEFELGNITATGGAGNDTFAFVTNAAGVTNSTFGAGDSITGGEGTDTIQIGVNGTATYNIALSEFASKTGIDVLDLRGNTNAVTLSSAFVAGADAGTFEVRSDRIVADNGTSTNENVSVSTIDLTNLSAGQAIKVTGGAGSERVVLSDATFTNNITVAGGTNVTNVAGAAATNGDYDTITVVNSAIIDRNDLANVSGVESIVLTKNTTGVNTFRVELTEAFLLANTSATDSSATNIDDASFVITDAAAANGTALAATDTVTIDISDLLTSTGALKTSLAGRGIDTTGIAATVSYVVNGAAATAAQIAAVTNAQNAGGVAALEASAAVTGAAAGAATGGAAATTTGNTFSLTAANAVLTTTANINATPASTYLTANTDTIAGGTYAGTALLTDATTTDSDSLSLTLVGATGALAPTWTNIENIAITANMTGAVGTDSLSLLGVTGATSVSVAAGKMNFIAAENENLKLTSGYTAALTANVTTVATDDLTIELAGTSSTATITTNVYDALTLNVSANSTVATLTGDSAGNGTAAVLNISGAGNLTITNAIVDFESINAANYTGVLTAILDASTASTVTAGSGNDSITTSGDWASSVYGAAGNDTIIASSVTTAAVTVRGGAGNDTITFDATDAGNTGVVAFEATAATNGVDTINEFAAGAGLNKLDFRAFVSGKAVDAADAATDGTADAQTGATVLTEFVKAGTLNLEVNNNVALIDNAGTAFTATTLAAEFGANGAATSFTQAVGLRTVILEATGNGAGVIAAGTVNIWYVNDADSSGTISASEVVLVGTLAAVDADAINGNQIL